MRRTAQCEDPGLHVEGVRWQGIIEMYAGGLSMILGAQASKIGRMTFSKRRVKITLQNPQNKNTSK